MKNIMLLGAAIAALSTGAQAANTAVTTTSQTININGVNFTSSSNPGESSGGGSNAITANRGDTKLSALDTRSLEVHGDRTRYSIGTLFGNVASPGFLFSQLSALTFDWNVGVNGSIQPHASPAIRVNVADTDGRRAELVWEYVYNGGTAGVAAPLDTWTTADSNSLFYANIRSGSVSGFGAGAATIGNGAQGVVALDGNNQSNLTLADWHNYFSPNAKVIGFSIGAGSTVGSNFVGYVDNVGVVTSNGTDRLNFGDAIFPAATGDVPEPATWAMMLIGFGAVGVAARRRKAGFATA